MINTAAASKRLNVSARRVRALCKQGRIKGAKMIGRDWAIPDKFEVLPPARKRKKNNAQAVIG